MTRLIFALVLLLIVSLCYMEACNRGVFANDTEQPVKVEAPEKAEKEPPCIKQYADIQVILEAAICNNIELKSFSDGKYVKFNGGMALIAVQLTDANGIETGEINLTRAGLSDEDPDMVTLRIFKSGITWVFVLHANGQVYRFTSPKQKPVKPLLS